ncbi:hypothetical protein Tco_0787346 [Tanacetum coccineum]
MSYCSTVRISRSSLYAMGWCLLGLQHFHAITPVHAFTKSLFLLGMVSYALLYGRYGFNTVVDVIGHLALLCLKSASNLGQSSILRHEIDTYPSRLIDVKALRTVVERNDLD